MKRCARGAIIGHTELAIFENALVAAIDSLECTVRSETRPNRTFHDDDYLRHMLQLKNAVVVYQRALKEVQRIRKGH